MHLYLKFHVKSALPKVWAGFNESLFLALAPPFPKAELVRFDGCKKGDFVEIKLKFGLFSQFWKSEITENFISDTEIYFIDKGTKLPFFLSSWTHTHRLQTAPDGGTIIIEDIAYCTPFFLLDFLVYPALFVQFYYRKHVYERIFGR